MIELNIKIDKSIHPNFIIVYSLTNNAPTSPDISMVSILVIDVMDKVSSTSASSLMTDAVSILTHYILEDIDLILVSSLVTGASYNLVNDVIDKVSSTSVSSLVTNTASVLTNDTIENINSTLISSLETSALDNSKLLTPSLFTFSHISLSFNLIVSQIVLLFRLFDITVFLPQSFHFPHSLQILFLKYIFPANNL